MTYFRLHYHFVWTTKDRLPLITEFNEEPIYKAIQAKTSELHGFVHAVNGTADHIHVVVTLPPSVRLCDYAGQVKGVSSHLASRLADCYEPFGWQREYGVLTLSESHLPTLIRYVEQQKQHHAMKTLDTRLEPA
ncbi:MAG: IS200/IS605 family transposase [Anaerolineae bacterium]|nr:IS200/IS605 family transposase [Anaerolineae bacterium]